MTARPLLKLFVDGSPAPKGSVQVDPNHHVRHTARSARFEQLIRDAITRKGFLKERAAPVRVEAEFVIRRPPGNDDPFPTGLQFGDLDKHARTLLDGLTGTVLGDDSQVVELNVRKRFAAAAERIGVQLTVSVADESLQDFVNRVADLAYSQRLWRWWEDSPLKENGSE